MRLPVVELFSRLVSRRLGRPQDDGSRQLEAPSDEMPKMPRTVKYAWGAAVTLLLGLSLAVDRGSEWMPLVHRAIDLLQTQTAPTENK